MSDEFEREQFEHWMLTDAPKMYRGHPLVKQVNGRYSRAATHLAWQAWLASKNSKSETNPYREWPSFADGKRGCPRCGAYAKPESGEVLHRPDCDYAAQEAGR
jgi:hypothetical protein